MSTRLEFTLHLLVAFMVILFYNHRRFRHNQHKNEDLFVQQYLILCMFEK